MLQNTVHAAAAGVCAVQQLYDRGHCFSVLMPYAAGIFSQLLLAQSSCCG
jgi:hypothetical protein